MRLTEFWRRMELVFGQEYAHSWAQDMHLSALDGHTVMEAIGAGVTTKAIWRAVCEHADVPPTLT